MNERLVHVAGFWGQEPPGTGGASKLANRKTFVVGALLVARTLYRGSRYAYVGVLYPKVSQGILVILRCTPLISVHESVSVQYY